MNQPDHIQEKLKWAIKVYRTFQHDETFCNRIDYEMIARFGGLTISVADDAEFEQLRVMLEQVILDTYGELAKEVWSL